MPGNILIVDDSPIDKKILRQILERRLKDITIFETDSGIDIANLLVNHNISVCILDILLPGKNGFQILMELKEDAALMHIPVIVCTGINDKQAIEKSLLLGAYDYFSKPLSEEAMKISLPLKVKNAIELKQRNDDIIYLSYHDKLTGLFNRRYFDEELYRLNIIKDLPISLIVGDVNGLKLTNDVFGHEAGDKLLIKIADIIKGECSSDDIAARIGGDEFLIILPGTTLIEAQMFVSNIKQHCLCEPENPIKPSISMGCATKEHYGMDATLLFKIAEGRMYSNKQTESKCIKESIISSLRKSLHRRTFETEGFCDELVLLSHKIGKELNLSEEQMNNLALLAMFHNIGIAGIPRTILSNHESLSENEQIIMDTHSDIGYRIASSSPELSQIAHDILCHHENWDGSGYPHGLSGENIPLNSRILSVIDSYVSMINGVHRSSSLTKMAARSLIAEQSGKHFDPEIVDAFIKITEGETHL
jgi:diguanylate cyclase (GGDEF)-like protein